MPTASAVRGFSNFVCLVGFALLSALDPGSATLSQVHTYRTAIDLGNDPATGCDFSLGSLSPSNLPGFELEVTVVVDSHPIPPQLVSAEVASCSGNGGSFGSPQALAGFVDHEPCSRFLRGLHGSQSRR